jgi:uncharacterized membrane protein
MKSSSKKVVLQAIGLGAVAGMRATMAATVTSHYLNNHPNPAISRSAFRFIQLPVTATVTKLLTAVELTGDKIPGAPDRISPPQVAARILSGAFIGATVFKANRQSLLTGALLGGASALAVTFGSFFLRKYIDELPYALDPVTGVVEDAIALGSGLKLIKA